MTTVFFDLYIDRGGTFTDVFYRVQAANEIKEGVLKLLSEDPLNYADAPCEAIKRITADYPDHKIRTIRMGTTVSTNALLEHKGCRTAFITTKGFKDLLEIAYQNRPKIFDLNIQKACQLYETVIELEERQYLNSSDEDLLDLESIKKHLLELKSQGIESLAIAFMHSYKNPSHELKVKELAFDMGFKEISLSSELVPMIKFVPRASTTVIDAYLAPVIKKYIENFKAGFEDGLKNTELLFMKSDGSLCDENEFRGFNSILSGPAGGVTALQSLYHNSRLNYEKNSSDAKLSNPENAQLTDVSMSSSKDEYNVADEDFSYGLIGFDMGGTSTDVSRYAGKQNLSFDSEIEGLLLQSPQLDINTIAAGGGSRLFIENGLFRVGPESAGSHPGPVSYKKNGYLAITDANLLLGKLNPDFFPKVFGPSASEALDYKAAYKAFEELKLDNKLDMSVEEIAQGFIQVANETMARPIREVSSAKGYDVCNHDLVCFGGAAAQHAVAIAKILGIEKVIIHKYSGILSAYGLSLAYRASQKQKAFGDYLSKIDKINLIFDLLCQSLKGEGVFQRSLILRFEGTDTKFLIDEPADKDYQSVFKEQYLREFGFSLDREVICDDVIVKRVSQENMVSNSVIDKPKNKVLTQLSLTKIFFNSKWHEAPVYNFDDLTLDVKIEGPALIMQDTATIVVEPDSYVCLDEEMNLNIFVSEQSQTQKLENNPINLAIFSNRFMSIAEQMGKTLERTSISTNIKERRDFSCAIFNKEGDLIANAPHQPVHLGSMGYAVKKQIESCEFKSGDAILSNHPVMGGSHLPDLTVITPVFNDKKELIFFVANRAHHADIGGISPGSMPSFSKDLSQEGVAVKSFKLLDNNKFQEDKLRKLFQESRLLDDNVSDLRAQIAANNQGISLIKDLIVEYSQDIVLAFMDYILENSQKVVEEYIAATIGSELNAFDFLDDGSKINLKITKIDNKNLFEKSSDARLMSLKKRSLFSVNEHFEGECNTADEALWVGSKAVFDFTGSANELDSNLNTPIAVLSSAILYCLRAIINKDIPLNQGFLRPIEIIVPEKSLLNPSENKAVVAGNVLTSQRIVDVIFKAFSTVAASQGCMNNVIFGRDRHCQERSDVAISRHGEDPEHGEGDVAIQSFGYYETIGGGAGAGIINGVGFHGASGVHTHMTNTRITDPEILESRYPVILKEFSIRKDSGGKGKFNGGDGLVRIFKFLDKLDLSLLTERRVYAPYGLIGGSDARQGENWLIRGGQEEKLASKVSLKLESGDELKILTPGGGGFSN